jgi:cell wall assembly regulator SMI1
MFDLWETIERLLESKSDSLLQVLTAPVDFQEVRFLSSLNGSDNLVESLQVHNGQRNGLIPLIDPWILLKADQIEKENIRLNKLFLNPDEPFDDEIGTEAIGPVKPDLWNQAWFPFAADGSGNYLCVDCDPPSGGIAGQVILWASDPPYVEVIAPSYRAWLEQFASDLEAGKYKWDTEDESWSRVDN